MYRSESKMSSNRHQTTDVLKEKMLPSRGNQNFKCQVKDKAQTSFSQPFLNPLYELQPQGGIVHERKVQVKSSEDCQKSHLGSRTSNDDELVKYMTKIPGYLQQLDKGKNVQERALNFGVLDFKRLEKWKYNERMPGRCHRKFPSSGSKPWSIAHRQPLDSTNSPQRKHPTQCRLYVNSSHERKLSESALQSPGNVTKVQDSLDAPCDKADGDRKHLHGKVKSTKVRSCPVIVSHKSKWKELDEKPPSEIKAYQDTQPKVDATRFRESKHNRRVKKKGNGNHHRCPTEPQSIVLLVPQYSSKLSCSESSQFSESRSSCDGQFEPVNGSRFSNCLSSQELHSGEIVSEIPHSCPFPTNVSIDADSTTKSKTSLNAPYIESDVSVASCPNEMLMCMTPLEARIPKENKSNLKPSVSTEPYKKMDLEAADDPEAKGRHPSPNRRFSFSLGRISRSFSFKDSSAVPHLNSSYTTIKSGPISSETSAGTGNCNRDKASTSARGRSSPLRRLLDPLMKPRGTHSGEAVRPTSGNKNFPSPKPININESLQVKNHELSKVQALLQLTVKNDLPFFKLVVDNSSDILAAAAVKNAQSGDPRLTYAFYSVREIIKKSGGWMSQGSKSRSCSFGYNTIGQMNISYSYDPDSNAQNPSKVCLVTESILYDVDLGNNDLQGSELLKGTEVAVIIVKNPAEKVNEGGLDNEDDWCKQKNYIRCSLGSHENFSSTIVILPGGIHGLPNQGAPSSLIDRWRSGGSCDCGGWDIGCKLRAFINQDTIDNTLMPSDRINLFRHGGEPGSKPIFNLAPFKNGLYSVEFNASMSLLEAFSTCVAIITTRKFSHILELKTPSGEKRFSDVTTGSGSTKTPTTNQGLLPAKYVTSPPPSPVGRI